MNKRQKLIGVIVIFSLLVNSFVFPPQTYARNPFKALVKGIKQSTRFIIKLPDRATRWMGPVLGPIASFVLTKNLMKNPKIAKIFRRARKAQRVFKTEDDIKKSLANVRKMYRDEAQKLRDKTDILVQARKDLAKDLLRGGDFQKYKKQVADMQEVIEIHKSAADKFDTAAQNMRTKDVIRMVSDDFLKAAWTDVKNVVLTETSKELSKVTDPKIIKTFIKKGGVDSIIDFFVDKEVSKVLKQRKDEDIDWDQLRENLKKSVKEQLKKNKKLFKEGWKKKIDELLKKQIEEMKKTKEELEEKEKKVIDETVGEIGDKDKTPDDKSDKKVTGEQQNFLDEFEELLFEAQEEEKKSIAEGKTTSNEKCPTGYAYRPSWGKDCIQVNCPKVTHAHWDSTGGCVCGSSGSMVENPEDPNKECGFSREYTSCPSCIYACVHFEEDCPLDGIGPYVKK